MQLWVDKYRPKNTKEIVGQEDATVKLLGYVRELKRYKGKAALLYGSVGTGKTSLPYAIANELDLEIIEVNASDFRNEDSINATVKPALEQRSLFFREKLILVDEVDGLSGREDRGGVSALAALIAKSKFPIVMTANDPFDKRLSPLRQKSLIIQLRQLPHEKILMLMERICKKEGITYEPSALSMLARRAGSDLRGAITDLQLLTYEDKKLERSDVEELSERNREDKLADALMRIFKSSDINVSLNALENVDEELDRCLLWIDENLPREYLRPGDLSDAYYYLSKADIFRNRIKRWQYWRFLFYMKALMTAGVSVSKEKKYEHFVNYSSERVLKFWIAAQKYRKRNNIAAKIAMNAHTSKKKALQEIPYLKIIFKKDKLMGGAISQQLGLEKEEEDWLAA